MEKKKRISLQKNKAQCQSGMCGLYHWTAGWWCCHTLQVWKYTNVCQFASRRTGTEAAWGCLLKNISMYQLFYQITWFTINTHTMLKMVATSPSLYAVSSLFDILHNQTVSGQKTFIWTCFFDLQLRTFTSCWLIWWWALYTRLAPVRSMKGNLILKLHQIKIKSIFLDNLLYLDAVYVVF